MKRSTLRFLVTLLASLPIMAFAKPNVFLSHQIAGHVANPTQVVVSDCDQDGTPDLVVSGSGGTQWLDNDGHGQFTPDLITSVAFTSKATVANPDGDGDLDLVAGLGSAGWGFSWWENTGSGFTRHDVDPPVGDYTFASEDTFPGDMDGDHDLDVVVAGGLYEDKSFAWWENQGASWTRHTYAGDYLGSKKVRVFDIDQDGLQDVVLVFFGSPGAIVWWENQGSGAFVEHKIGDCLQPWDVSPIDLDGDGDIDLLTADGFGIGFIWWENDGAMNFTPHTIKGGAVLTTSIGAADLDGDGHLDVYGTDPGNGDVLWFKNDGSQNFTEYPVVDGTLNNTWSIGSADFNGDGNPDLVAVSDVSNKLIWWENEFVANRSFESGPRIPASWKVKNLTTADKRTTTASRTGSASMLINGSVADKALSQTLKISGQAGDVLKLGGWSRSSLVPPGTGFYCLEAKVVPKSGAARFYRVPFGRGTHAWQYRNKTFTVPVAYTSITVSLRYANSTGRAWFDDVRLE